MNSRRNFLKALGLASATPFIAYANNGEQNNKSNVVNMLDYCEEGTFTPVIEGVKDPKGTYTKIGNIVHYTINGIPVTNTVGIKGLPFKS